MENEELHRMLKRVIALQEKILERLAAVEHSSTNHKIDDDLLEDLLDSTDVKAILKISTSTLYRIKRSGLIHAKRIGRRNYFSKAEINKLANFYLR